MVVGGVSGVWNSGLNERVGFSSEVRGEKGIVKLVFFFFRFGCGNFLER